MFRHFRLRCHLVRVVRYALFLAVGMVAFTAVWRYLVSSNGFPAADHDDVLENDIQEQVPRDQGGNSKIVASFLSRNTIQKGKPDKKSLYTDKKPLKVDRKQQAVIDYIASSLDIRYHVVSNEGGRFHVNITLTNVGDQILGACCYAIYFYHMKFIDTYAFNAGMSIPLRGEPADHQVQRLPANFILSHVNGYTFKMQPSESFKGLSPGASETMRWTGGGWSVSRGEVLPNWYVANDDAATEPRLIQSTASEDVKFVGKFDRVEQTIRGDDDLHRPFTAEQRYLRNKVVPVSNPDFNAIIPTPLHVNRVGSRDTVQINGLDWKVYYVNKLENEARYVKDALQLNSIEQVDSVKDITDCDENTILLSTSKEQVQLPEDVEPKQYNMNEAYTMAVSRDRKCIAIVGRKPVGVYYGVVSLVSLAHGSSMLQYDKSDGYVVPAVEITDAPRYEYRGIMIDVARNFHTIDELSKLIDVMSMYKLNKLHLHLADDEGWRLEIPTLDELVEVGGRRGHDPKEQNHLMSMLGSGPFTNSSGSGYYTVEEYQGLLRHAVSRHVEVVPEFDMPSHSHAAIKSMERRYKRLRNVNKNDEDESNKASTKYLLTDLNDQSVYMTGQYFRDSAINPCIESSYRFVEEVISAVVSMHRDIMPLRRWHFGGDEVPQDAYSGSLACQLFLQKHSKLKSTKDLKTYFVRRLVSIAARYGLSVFGWEDAFSTVYGTPIPRDQLKTDLDVVSEAYYNTWESGAASKAYQYANSGYKVLLSPITALYYDNPQEPDPEDWGLHWATRFVDTKRTFRFAPESMYDSIDEEYWGKATSRQELCGRHRILCLPLKRPENIIGMEAALWSELIRTPGRLESLLWPRLFALAERSWHRSLWELKSSSYETDEKHSPAYDQLLNEDWARFATVVGYKELRRIEAYEVNYYVPRSGARIRNGKLYVNAAFPGLVVQVSTDNGKTWSDFSRSVPYTGRLLLATRTHTSLRRSVPVEIVVS